MGQVNFSTTPEELLVYFESCGTVEHIKTVCNKFTMPQGFAYLEFWTSYVYYSLLWIIFVWLREEWTATYNNFSSHWWKCGRNHLTWLLGDPDRQSMSKSWYLVISPICWEDNLDVPCQQIQQISIVCICVVVWYSSQFLDGK